MLEAVIKGITPKILTWSQYAEAAWFMYNKKVLGNPNFKRYVPDYTQCIEHFALHAGRAPVVERYWACTGRMQLVTSCTPHLQPHRQWSVQQYMLAAGCQKHW